MNILDKQMQLRELVDANVGPLCIAIGKGTFRDAVSILIQNMIELGYDRAVQDRKKNG